jgi:hypothetical protein
LLLLIELPGRQQAGVEVAVGYSKHFIAALGPLGDFPDKVVKIVSITASG